MERPSAVTMLRLSPEVRGYIYHLEAHLHDAERKIRRYNNINEWAKNETNPNATTE